MGKDPVDPEVNQEMRAQFIERQSLIKQIEDDAARCLKVDVNNPKNPVFIERRQGRDKIFLRIGYSRPGKSRISVLSSHEARLVAHSLLLQAERVDRPETQPV